MIFIYFLKGDIHPNEVLDETAHSLYFILPITFSSCQAGEIFDLKENRCIQCQVGKYTFFNNETECRTCPDHCLCKGGNNIYISPGYWRPSIYSTNIYECSFEDFCIGGNGVQCKDNHSGKLCEECTKDSLNRITKKNYFGDCLACELDQGAFVANIFLVIIVSSVLIFLISIYVFALFSENQRVRIKIIVNFIQNIYFIPFWTLITKDTNEFSFFSNNIFNFSRDLFSLDCFFLYLGIVELTIFDKLIIKIVYILVVLVICLVFLSTCQIFVLKKIKFIDITLVMYNLHYLIFPFIAKDCFSTLSCLEIAGGLYILNELQIKCWTKDFILYEAFLVFPILFAILIIIPTMAMLKYLKKIVESLKNSKTQLKSIIHNNEKNIIFLGYRNSHPTFEAYKFVQKILVILFATIYERKKMRILYSLLSYSLNLVLTWRKSPFKNKKMTTLENTQLSITMFAYIALFYSNLAQNSIFNQVIFNAIISLFGIYFLISLCRFFCRTNKNLIENIKNRIIRNILFLIFF